MVDRESIPSVEICDVFDIHLTNIVSEISVLKKQMANPTGDKNNGRYRNPSIYGQEDLGRALEKAVLLLTIADQLGVEVNPELRQKLDFGFDNIHNTVDAQV